MIVGFGTDVHDIERTADAIARNGSKYLERLFTASEIAAGEVRTDAAAFFRKAVCCQGGLREGAGTGISNSVRWLDMEIRNDELRAPHIALAGGAMRRAKKLLPPGSTATFHLSMATADGTAIATVILEARFTLRGV